MKIESADYFEGLSLILKNVDNLHFAARDFFSKEKYRLAFFFAFTAWEELGKANILLDHWHKKAISKEEWESPKLFKGHVKKIVTQRNRMAYELIKNFLDNNPDKTPDNGPIKVVTNSDFLPTYLKIRNDCLYIGYNFVENKWINPHEIKDLKKHTSGLLDEVHASIRAMHYRIKRDFKEISRYKDE